MNWDGRIRADARAIPLADILHVETHGYKWSNIMITLNWKAKPFRHNASNATICTPKHQNIIPNKTLSLGR